MSILNTLIFKRSILIFRKSKNKHQIFPLKMDEESRPHLSQKQIQYITDIFNEIFIQPLNKLS